MTPDKTFFHKRYSEKDYKFTFKYDKGILNQILKLKGDGKILDLGCGEGGLSLKLAEKGFDVTCVDISKTAINKIQREAKKRKIKINAIESDLKDYKIKNNYDLILALGIIHFLGNMGEGYIRKIQRHTQKGGINIIDAFINGWLPKNKIKELYKEWKTRDYEEYKQKLINGDKKWMNYLVAEKRCGGWQCWVDVYKDYVIKTPKTRKEISETIKRYLDSIKKPEELEKRTEQMIKDIKNSIKIIKNSKIPKKLFAYSKFLPNGKIKQKKVIILEEKFRELVMKKRDKEIKRLINKSIDFIIELWKYQIHEKTFKIYSNFGLIDNEIVLVDLFELTNKKEKVEKQVINKKWTNIQKTSNLSKEHTEYFLTQVGKRLTIKKLNEVWGEKTK